MGKSNKKTETREIRPAMSVEAKENMMISLAVDLAEKQLREGTASSQVVTHYLKLGSTKERLEKEKLIEENKLLKAKTENIKSMANMETLYAEAIKAMQVYSGSISKTESEESEYDDEDE